jgi:hypothetical protein
MVKFPLGQIKPYDFTIEVLDDENNSLGQTVIKGQCMENWIANARFEGKINFDGANDEGDGYIQIVLRVTDAKFIKHQMKEEADESSSSDEDEPQGRERSTRSNSSFSDGSYTIHRHHHSLEHKISSFQEESKLYQVFVHRSFLDCEYYLQIVNLLNFSALGVLI